MRYIYNTRTDPAFNLAAEEWLLRNTDDEVFMLWRNAPSVIVGRNQNTAAEIDQAFVQERGIAVIRRLTGGGAVFHDLGNVNFTFIQRGQQGRSLDFHRFAAPILEALQAMGVPCQFEGRNDLTIEGQKFSGNAQLLEKNRVLHHGTLLFASRMTDLSGALRVNPVKYAHKAVKSVPKRVTNISDHLPEPLDVETFIARVMTHVSGGDSFTDLLDNEAAAIGALADAKYRTWEWNFGASPAYGFSQSTRTQGGVVEVHLDVRQGHIQQARIFGDFFGTQPVADLETLLAGCRHEQEALLQRLERVQLDGYIRHVNAETFVQCLICQETT